MKITCPKCQFENETNEQRCSKCGYVFSDELSEALLENVTLELPELDGNFHSLNRTVDLDHVDAESAADIGTVDFDQPSAVELHNLTGDDEAKDDNPLGELTEQESTGFTAEIADLVKAPTNQADDSIGTVDFDTDAATIRPSTGDSIDFDSEALGNSTSLMEANEARGPSGTVVNDAADIDDEDLILSADDQSKAESNPGITVVEIQTVQLDPAELNGADIDLGPVTETDGSVIDGGADQTVQFISSSATLEFDGDEFDRVGPGGTVGDRSANRTIADGVSDKTIDLSDLTGSPGTDSPSPVSPSTGTVGEGSSAATIDVSALGPAYAGLFAKPGDSLSDSRRPSSDTRQGSVQGSMNAHHTGQTAVTGTTGRVQRIWQGVSHGTAGNTLKAAAQMASDEIFDLVQPRVMVAEDMDALIRGSKSDRDRQLIEHCLQVACRNSLSEQADYEINGFLGKGAMGMVLQARQKSIGRDVAIKMIQPPSSPGATTVANTRDMHRKFLYEAQVTGKLDHPNIVPVYELGTSNGALFYSMKKISGVEWTKKLKQLTQDENLDIWMKVADALAFSHQRNIIHRDLKPENIMLGSFGEVLVTDWGCAVDLTVHKTFSGAGSPPWMAPEMALQQHDLVGPKSDMYLLGAILYQIVVGHPPHPGRTAMEALMAAARNQIIEVDNPDPLLDIAYRAMKTNPSDRYENLGEMQEAIREYRKHSESIAICQRCESTLSSAIESSDYEKFSRSVFGFQDALQLWPENQAASAGLARARLAYGKCALARKDFDLCIETLDRSVPDENEIYQQAIAQKQVALSREKRVQTLRRSFFGAVTVGLAVSALLAAIAWIQRNDAVTQKELANTQKELAENSAKSEKIAKEIAIKAREVAERAAESEREARKNEQQAKEKAVAAQMAAEQSAASERQAKLQEQQARIVAQTAQKEAEEAAESERAAKLETLRRSAQVELAAMRSNLALALNQVSNLEIARASESLQSVIDSRSYQALNSVGLQPKMDTWAWQRVNLLSNRDRIQPAWAEGITAFEFSQQDQVGAMAVRDKNTFGIKKFKLVMGRIELIADQAIELPRAVTSLAILEGGNSIAFTLKSASNLADSGNSVQPTAYLWRTTVGKLVPLNSVQNESLQGIFAVGEKGVVAGLNQGLWYWSDITKNDAPLRIRHIQGQLQGLHVVDAKQLVLLAETATQTIIHWVQLDQPDQKRFLKLESKVGPSIRPTAIAFHQGKLIVGMQSGQLYSFSYDPKAQNEQVVEASRMRELPASHASAIQNIRVNADGTLVSFASEPTVRVWRPSQHASGWSDHGWLSGPTSNIQSVAFGLDSKQVLACARDATTAFWNTEQLLLRERIQYPSQTASATNIAELASPVAGPKSEKLADSQSGVQPGYDAPVVAVVTSNSGTTAVSILANGRVDRWNPQTGQQISSRSLAHAGHDPSAELIDMDIDEAAAVMVTAAKLPTTQSRSDVTNRDRESKAAPDIKRLWEFVKWDLNSGQMLDRWTIVDAEEQPVSLADHGKLILYGSDKKTVIQSSDSQRKSLFQSDDFGSYFSSVNPKNPSEIMLVKLNGVVRIIDTRQVNQSWKQPGRQLNETDFHKLATKGDRVVLGRWSPGGERYFLIWESGRISQIEWRAGRLSLQRDLIELGQKLDLTFQGQSNRKISDDTATKLISTKTNESSIRITSRWSIDAKVRMDGDREYLYVLVRFPGSDGLTRFSRIEFPKDPIAAVKQTITDRKYPQLPVALSDDAVPQVSESASKAIKKSPALRNADLLSVKSLGRNLYCATKRGDIYRISDEGVHTFGSTTVLSGAGDETASRIATLHLGGAIWRADWQDGWRWTQLTAAPTDSRQIHMSPDGQSLLVVRSGGGCLLLSSETGQPLNQPDELASAKLAKWNRTGSMIALVDRSGVLRIVERGQSREVAKLPENSNVDQIGFFEESWTGGKRATSWIVARSGDLLRFYQVDGQKSAELKLPEGVTTVEPSPIEGILAVGGQGTLAVYFCVPSLDEPGRELFSLTGHKGSKLRCLHFTADGRTLISTDNSHRQMSWLSAQP